MFVLSPQAIAALTIGFGLLSSIIGIGLVYYFHPCRAGRQGVTALVSYAFSAGPIILLVYNCFAFALNEWGGFVPAVAPGAPTAEQIATSPTLGVGAPLLAYAGLAVLVNVSADVWESIKTHFVADP